MWMMSLLDRGRSGSATECYDDQPWDFGFFDDDGKFVEGGRTIHEPRVILVNPWPRGSRVRIAGSNTTGIVRVNAFADDYSFRVQLADGSWARKTTSRNLRNARGWGTWNFVLRGFRRVPRYLREHFQNLEYMGKEGVVE